MRDAILPILRASAQQAPRRRHSDEVSNPTGDASASSCQAVVDQVGSSQPAPRGVVDMAFELLRPAMRQFLHQFLWEGEASAVQSFETAFRKEYSGRPLPRDDQRMQQSQHSNASCVKMVSAAINKVLDEGHDAPVRILVADWDALASCSDLKGRKSRGSQMRLSSRYTTG